MKRDLETAMETDISPVSNSLSHFSEYFVKRQRVLENEMGSQPLEESTHASMHASQTLCPLELSQRELLRMLKILEVDNETGEHSWAALQTVVNNAADSRVLTNELLSVWAASAIWVYRKSKELSNRACTLSSGSQVYSGSCISFTSMLNLINTTNDGNISDKVPFFTSGIQSFLEFLASSMDISPLQSCINSINLIHSSLSADYDLFYKIFNLLMKKPQNSLDMAIVFKDYQNYSWIFYCCARQVLFKNTWKVPQELYLVGYCVSFIGVQFPSHYRKTIKEIQLFWNQEFPNVQLDPPSSLINESIMDQDWTYHILLIRHLICGLGGFPLESYQTDENTCIDKFMNILSQKNLFRYENRILDQNGYMKYPGAFDPARTGLFYNNSECLYKFYDLLMIEMHYDIDGRLFRPRQVANATVRRITRTPRASVILRQTGSKNLKAAFEKASIFNQNMPATPLTAKGLLQRNKQVNTKTQASDISTSQQWIRSILEQISTDASKYVAGYLNKPDKVIHNLDSRIDSFVQSLSQKDSMHSELWEMSAKMYFMVMNSMLKKHSTISKSLLSMQVSYDSILLDSQFNRCLIAACCEIIRHAFKPAMKFEDIVRMLDAKMFELGLVIELLQNCDMVFPCYLVKRLVELEERIMESEIWKDPTLYQLMDEGNVSNGTKLQEITRFYLFLVSSADQQKNIENPECIAFQFLLKKVSRLILLRLKSLCDSLQVPESLFKMTSSFMEMILKFECKIRILCNRHLDVIMNSCLFACCRLQDHPLTFKEILLHHRQQPQYIETTFSCIFMGEGEPKSDILVFYNKLFLPAFKHLHQMRKTMQIPSDSSQLTNRPIIKPSSRLLAEPSPFRRLAAQNILKTKSAPSSSTMSSNANIQPGMMTPMTKKLYNFGEQTPAKPGSPSSTSCSNPNSIQNRAAKVSLFGKMSKGLPPRAPLPSN